MRIYLDNGRSRDYINVSDKAFETYSYTDPISIQGQGNGLYTLTGTYNLTDQTENDINKLLEADHIFLEIEAADQGIYF